MKYPLLFYGGALVVILVAPFLLSAIVAQLAFMWVMIVLALSWDLIGGQMGYNSFGNIIFFGIGMYACAVVQRDSGLGYFTGLAAGIGLSIVIAMVAAAILGSSILRLRGHYFSIATLGLGVAAGEFASSWDYIGAGSGMVTPLYPGEIEDRNLFYYFLFAAMAAITHFFLKWLYSTRFGLSINAIRDDEDKAEAMGLHTTRYKITAWCICAFFLSIVGAGVGNINGFIDPRESAFAGPTFGVWMILMAILGGTGSLWGPVMGAVVFHITQELFWTYLLGWQRVALGILIVVIVIFFPTGIMGWLNQRWPELFGEVIDTQKRQSAKGDHG